MAAPAPAPVPAPTAPAPAPVPAAPAPVPVASAGVASAGAATWPCGACGEPNPIEQPACLRCGTAFLAAVREGQPALVLPLLGDLSALTPVRRVGLALALLAALLVTAAVLGTLLG